MTPPLFRGIVIDAAGLLAFRAYDVLADILELDDHLLADHGKVHGSFRSCENKAKKLLVMRGQGFHNGTAGWIGEA